MLHSYNTREDVVEGYNCGTCNRRTTATVRNHVHNYPKVLAIALSHGSDNDTLIESCVNYPFENFTPYTHSDRQDQEDTGDATYDLVATINHAPQMKGGNEGSHYTATCKQHNSGVWYDYDNGTVGTSSFSKKSKGGLIAKSAFQQSVGLLFYIRREPPQDDTGIMTSSAVCC